jgi:hypothetical protein
LRPEQRCLPARFFVTQNSRTAGGQTEEGAVDKPDPYRNPYRMPPQERMALTERTVLTLLAATAFGVLLIVGGLLYAYYPPGASVASTPAPVPATTGQSR